MKVLLTKNVSGQGHAGEVLEVADAYARNFLFPKKLAQPASAETIAAVAAAKQRQEKNMVQSQQAVLSARQRLVGQTLALTGAANPQGKFFAAIKSADILSALQRQFDLPEISLKITPDHLKLVGAHKITLAWPDGTTTELAVSISAKQK